MFAALSGDWHPMHTDREAARESQYGERIAHGLLTLSAGLNLLFRHGGFGNGFLPSSITALTALDRVQFKLPVRIGDTLRLRAEIAATRPMFERQGLIETRFDVINQRDESVLTGRFSLLAASREPLDRHGAHSVAGS